MQIQHSAINIQHSTFIPAPAHRLAPRSMALSAGLITIARMGQRVTILGDGAMATVCSILLESGGHTVTLWGAFEESIQRLIQNRENQRLLPGVSVPPAVRLTANESECFTDCTLVLSAIPCQFLRSVWKRVGPFCPEGVPIISVAKGLETQTLLRPTQIIDELLADQRMAGRRKAPNPLAALSGPNIAAEIARYLPATAVAATADPALARHIQETFNTQWFRVYTNSDVIGVEVAGAAKNVIAIAAGILDGLGAGSNAKAALVTRGLVEMTRLGVAMGAQEATFHGLAGLGDLITTCISPEGRNRRVGEQIGKGRKLPDILHSMDSVAEGVPTTRAVMELAHRYHVELPITQAVWEVLFEQKDVLRALSDLMTRESKAE